MFSTTRALTMALVILLTVTTTTMSWAPPTTTVVRASSVTLPTTTGLSMAPPPVVEKETDATSTDDESVAEDAKTKMANLMKPIKEAGVAGALSLFLWEAAFWILSVPACSIAYYKTTGAWPDWSNAEDVAKVGAEAFAFANIARFALPLRVGLAISTTPWVQANLVDRFGGKTTE